MQSRWDSPTYWDTWHQPGPIRGLEILADTTQKKTTLEVREPKNILFYCLPEGFVVRTNQNHNKNLLC